MKEISGIISSRIMVNSADIITLEFCNLFFLHDLTHKIIPSIIDRDGIIMKSTNCISSAPERPRANNVPKIEIIASGEKAIETTRIK